ncbi:MAG: hypothetical protein PHS02_03630 [Candidatus ainarchaeum sp.]|nr:hypothetical protein [Candidatus ainarchaeum sp.]
MKPQEAFRETSRVLFGQEIGELTDFADYLGEFVLPCQNRKSFISGKDVLISHNFYPSSAKFISHDEMSLLGSKFTPLETKDIKDIDSLLSAVRERVVFCGNKVLGKCENVQNVDNCVECSDVFQVHNVFHVRNSAYTSYVREADHVFGVGVHPLINYSMRCLEGIHLMRCFESFYCSKASDCYYSFNCSNSTDCFFTFNQRSARRMIGNVQLDRDKYAELKKKLLSEMADELKRKKKLFSMADLVNYDVPPGESDVEAANEPGRCPERVENAFRKTSSLMLGTELKNIDDYGPWLTERTLRWSKVLDSSGKPTYKVGGFPVVGKISSRKLVDAEEALKRGSLKIKEEDMKDLRTLMERSSKIAFVTFEIIDGLAEEVVDVPSIFVGSGIYRVWDTTNSKNCAYSSAAIESSFMFGGYLRVLDSHFSINCFDSTKLKTCFECDASYSLNASYFCHNSENLDNCMFCFNEKGKSYAIAGTEVGREEFMRLKKILLDHVNRELLTEKRTGLSIFSIKGTSFSLESRRLKPGHD